MKNSNQQDSNLDAVETTKTTDAIESSLDQNDASDDTISTDKTGMSADDMEQELEEILGGDDDSSDDDDDQL